MSGSAMAAKAIDPLVGVLRFDRLPAGAAMRVAYDMYLDRAPDPAGLASYRGALASRSMTHRELLQMIRGSSEFENRAAFTERTFAASMHVGRCRFIRSLPKAGRILDLGGTSLGDWRGAFVAMGYPYRFESLTVVDLPPEDRHAIYRSERTDQVAETVRGPVSYRYHSMVDLSEYADGSFDLVYSGQSIEHVPPEAGATVLAEAFRVLTPGGHLALDTPNGRVTRMQQAELIDPDHEVEYTWPELVDLVTKAGFEIVRRAGLNYGGEAVAAGRFDIDEIAGNCGMFDAVEDCYLMAVVARKPS